MMNENNDEDKKDVDNSFTLARFVSTWYIGAIVGFLLGNLNGNSTTAIIYAVVGAAVSWIFKQWRRN